MEGERRGHRPEFTLAARVEIEREQDSVAFLERLDLVENVRREGKRLLGERPLRLADHEDRDGDREPHEQEDPTPVDVLDEFKHAD